MFSDRRNVLPKELSNVQKVTWLRNSAVVVAVGQLFPHHFLRPTKLEQFFHM